MARAMSALSNMTKTVTADRFNGVVKAYVEWLLSLATADVCICRIELTNEVSLTALIL